LSIDPRTLVQFVVIAEEVSFSRAAMRLGIAQPWLSSRIRKLEEQLGFALFARTTRHVSLTEQGAQFLEGAKQVALSLDSASMLASQIRRKTERRLAIGAPPYSNQIGERRALIDRFSSAHSDVRVELEIGWSPTLVERVASGRLDLAFVMGVIPPHLEILTLCNFSLDIIVGSSDPLAARSTINPVELTNRSVAIFTRGLHPALYDLIANPLIEAGANMIPVTELDDAHWERLKVDSRLVSVQPHFSEVVPFPGLVSIQLQGMPTVPFSLVRRPSGSTPLSRAFWSFASQTSE